MQFSGLFTLVLTMEGLVSGDELPGMMYTRVCSNEPAENLTNRAFVPPSGNHETRNTQQKVQ